MHARDGEETRTSEHVTRYGDDNQSDCDKQRRGQ